MTNCTKEPENDAVKTHNDAIDLVSRQAAIREYQEVCSGIKCGECPFLIEINTEKGSHLITDCKLEAFLHNLPSAQPKTGKWIFPNGDITDRPMAECDQCGWYVDPNHTSEYDFCPHCGAKMVVCNTCKHWESDTGFCYEIADSDTHECHYERKE